MDASILAQEQPKLVDAKQEDTNVENAQTISQVKQKQLKVKNRYTESRLHEIQMQNKFLAKNILQIK